MVTERQVIAKIEALEDGHLQVREDTVIERDGVEIARTYARRVLPPSDVIDSRDPADVKAIAAIMWTPERIAAYREKLAEKPFDTQVVTSR
jgi:hypothetical protein